MKDPNMSLLELFPGNRAEFLDLSKHPVKRTPYPEKQLPSPKVVLRPSNWHMHPMEVGVKADVTIPYVVAIYGYGTSSHPDRNQPAAVIYAETEDDVIKAIQYASEQGISISTRSGGHQYGAFSSTTQNDITVDVGAFGNRDYDKENDVFVFGPGCLIEEVMATMTTENQFVPHGECTWVRLGGHIQTGGYSPCFSRAFGFLCDHITECTIYMAPKEVGGEPQKVIVTKPTEEKKGNKNFDLWWAILGGSPGNFGIITEIKIKGIKDADHPHVHAMTIACHYTKKTFQHFMEIMAEYNDDDNLPADFTFNVLMLEGNPSICAQGRHENIDVKMSETQPDVYGPRAGYCPPITCLIVNWNNVQGDAIKFTDTDEHGYCGKKIFDKIRKQCNHIQNVFEKIAAHVLGERFMALVDLQKKDVYKLTELDPKVGFGPRYGPNPYLGMDRWNMTNKLSNNGWAEKTAEALEEAHKGDGVWPTPQWGTVGGKHSKIKKENCGNFSALAHREASLSALYYVHYDNVREKKDVSEPLKLTKKVMVRMQDVCDEFVGPGDNRWLAFCGEDEDLDNVHECYYDSHQDWLDLLKIKRTYDPKDVFTPNLFGVGASRKFKTAPANSPALDSGDKRPTDEAEEPPTRKARLE